MKTIGYAIITTGFLLGAFSTLLDHLQVRWDIYAVAIILGACGVSLIRWEKQIYDQSPQRLQQGIQELRSNLTGIMENMDRLIAEKDSLPVHQFHRWIDREFPGYLSRFVEKRNCISALYGVQSYADIMGHFATGERYLNRIWSASADGYVDEIHEYLDKTREQFQEAWTRLHSLQEQS